MKFSQEQQSRIDAFLDSFVDLVSKEAEIQRYKDKTKYRPGSGLIELSSGLLVPELEESVLVMHHEFRQFVLDILAKLFGETRQNLDNKLFGFAERPMYEYITKWVFLFTHPSVKQSHRDKLRSLMLAGHYQYVSEDKTELERYLQSSEVRMKQKEIQDLESLSQEQYFNSIHGKLTSIQRSYTPDIYQGKLEELTNFVPLLSFQHMRTHANVWSLLEMLGDIYRTDRHRLLLFFYARQILEYFAAAKVDGVKDLVKEFDEIMDDLRKDMSKIMT